MPELTTTAPMPPPISRLNLVSVKRRFSAIFGHVAEPVDDLGLQVIEHHAVARTAVLEPFGQATAPSSVERLGDRPLKMNGLQFPHSGPRRFPGDVGHDPQQLTLRSGQKRVPHALCAGDPSRDGQRCVVDNRAIASAHTAAARNIVPRTTMVLTIALGASVR